MTCPYERRFGPFGLWSKCGFGGVCPFGNICDNVTPEMVSEYEAKRKNRKEEATKELMKLDEAIAHCAEITHSSTCEKCRAEHRQLASWLIELKHRRGEP